MNCPSCGTNHPDSANFCVQCGRSLKLTDRARSFVEWLQRGANAEAERRQVTILACDIVGSSLLAERMDPEEFLDLMNRTFEAILAPVFEYGGYLARLEGDGFKAFFGAPQAHEDDPLRAVRAGLAIQAAARWLEERLNAEGHALSLAVRVGIHTDDVVVGPVGASGAVEYTAMGIGIVLAARLESIAQPGTVLISEATQRLVEAYVEVVPLGPTLVKGRTQPVRVFEVTGLRTAAGLSEVLEVRSPLVGRLVELAMLQNAVAKLLDESAPRRRGGIAHIVGEAGVGKTRLISHVRSEMTAAYPQLVWLEGYALSQGQGSYGVLADLVRSYLGIRIEDRRADGLARLRHRMDHLFGSDRSGEEGRAQADELVTHLANLLSLHLEGDQVRQVSDLDPEAQERQMFRALRRLFERLAEDGPLVLAFDNLQEADEGAIRLLKDLMQLIDERPVLCIFAFRPQSGAACWQLRDVARQAYGKDNVEIVLHSLSAEACNELIENLLESPPGEELAEAARALIRDRSGGNPLFVEEVVRSLIDREVLKRSGSRWQVPGEIPTNYVPETLHGVILARLDRLDAATRRLLQMAAVIGRTFSFRVLRAVTQDDSDLPQRLVLLQRAELIRELRRGPEQAYTFIHALTQQVAYETLLRRQRREYHRRVAHCIEELYADRLEEWYEGLAFHYASAEDWSQALTYHIRFAQLAQQRYASSKAAEHYRHAWEIVRANRAGNQETERLLTEAQGDLDLLAGDYRAALDQYEAALALTHDLAQRARLLRKLGNVCQGSGSYEQGLRYLEQGLALVGASGDSAELASLYIGLGQIYHRQGKYQQAADLGLQALAVCQQVGDRPGTALANNLLGIANWAMGDLPTARSHLEKSLLIHASLGDVPGLAASYNNLGRVLADEGYMEQALNSFLQSKQLCLEIGHQHGLAIALSHLGELYQRSGQAEEAVACQEQALEIFNRIGFDGQEIRPEVLKMQVW